MRGRWNPGRSKPADPSEHWRSWHLDCLGVALTTNKLRAAVDLHGRREARMGIGLNAFRAKDPRFLLMYSALQFGPEEQAKPDGSLSLPYVAGALRRAHYEVSIL